jgi:hypothetical protein
MRDPRPQIRRVRPDRPGQQWARPEIRTEQSRNAAVAQTSCGDSPVRRAAGRGRRLPRRGDEHSTWSCSHMEVKPWPSTPSTPTPAAWPCASRRTPGKDRDLDDGRAVPGRAGRGPATGPTRWVRPPWCCSTPWRSGCSSWLRTWSTGNRLRATLGTVVAALVQQVGQQARREGADEELVAALTDTVGNAAEGRANRAAVTPAVTN